MPIFPGKRVVLSEDPRRTLVLSMNALCRAEEITGISFLSGEVAFQNLRAMRALVWAGLLHEQPGLSLADAGEIIDSVGMAHAFECVSKALVAAVPEPDGDGDGGVTSSDPPNA